MNAPAAAKDLRLITLEAAPWASPEAPGGRPVGVFPAIVAELERRTGYRIAIGLLPYARIDHELASGAADCTIVIVTPARARITRTGASVSDHLLGVIARKGVPLAAYDDLHRLRISVLRGADLEPRFDADPSLQKEFDTDYLTGLRKIAHQRVDAVAGAIPTMLYLARQTGLADALGDRLVLSRIPIALQCANRSPNLDAMPALDRAIEDMRRDGTLDRIKLENNFS